MGDSVARVNKPQLRGLLHASIKRNLIASLILAGASAVAWKIFVGDARKKKYADFYKTYDPEASFERMRKAGHMSSCPP